MVCHEAAERDAELLAALAGAYPGARVVWVTNRTGLEVLRSRGESLEAVVEPPFGVASGDLALIAYDGPDRRGTLRMELDAWRSGARALAWTVNGDRICPVSRWELGRRVLVGLLRATLAAMLGLVIGLGLLVLWTASDAVGTTRHG